MGDGALEMVSHVGGPDLVMQEVNGTEGVMSAIYALNTSRVCTGTADSRIFPDFVPGTKTPNGEPGHRSGVTGDVIYVLGGNFVAGGGVEKTGYGGCTPMHVFRVGADGTTKRHVVWDGAEDGVGMPWCASHTPHPLPRGLLPCITTCTIQCSANIIEADNRHSLCRSSLFKNGIVIYM